MFNIRAFTVGYGVQESEQMTVCRNCYRMVMDNVNGYPAYDLFESYGSEFHPWIFGKPCDNCDVTLGGTYGRFIRWNYWRKQAAIRNKRIKFHLRHHADVTYYNCGPCGN